MSKASTTITLALVGSAAVLLGFMTCRPDAGSTSQPARTWWPGTWFGGYGRGWTSGGRSLTGHSSSSTHGLSARGGFGGSGHAVGA